MSAQDQMDRDWRRDQGIEGKLRAAEGLLLALEWIFARRQLAGEIAALRHRFEQERADLVRRWD